jgi:hypothetical protein
MARLIKVIYTTSDDPKFGQEEDEVIVVSPDIVLEKHSHTDDGGYFHITKEPVADNQVIINIDRDTCPSFEINFDTPVDEINFNQLAQFTFLDFIRTFAK